MRIFSFGSSLFSSGPYASLRGTGGIEDVFCRDLVLGSRHASVGSQDQQLVIIECPHIRDKNHQLRSISDLRQALPRTGERAQPRSARPGRKAHSSAPSMTPLTRVQAPIGSSGASRPNLRFVAGTRHPRWMWSWSWLRVSAELTASAKSSV
jgi:hypothetical protein